MSVNKLGLYYDLTMTWPWPDHDLTMMTKAIPVTCDTWDTDYNSDNWEPESISIFVTWQLRVTLDSIRNSCDVLLIVIVNSDEISLTTIQSVLILSAWSKQQDNTFDKKHR